MENENPYKNLLEIGKIYKYEELCNAVGEDKKGGGNSKQAQIKRWKRYFLWNHPISKRTGNPSKKFEIIETYDVPLKIENKRCPGAIRFAKFNEYKIRGEYTEIYHKDKVFIIDTEDLEKVKQGRKFYYNRGYLKSIDGLWLHRLIMDLPSLNGRITGDDLVVHHIDGNSFDNRKCNLQIMTQSEHRELHSEKHKRDLRTEEYWIYIAKNENKYIQTYNSYLAHAIRYATGIQFYKITIWSKVIYSFNYTEDLLSLFEELETIKKRYV